MQGAGPLAELQGSAFFFKCGLLVVRMRTGVWEKWVPSTEREGCNSSLLQPLAQASLEGAAVLPATPEDPSTTLFGVNPERWTLQCPVDILEDFVPSPWRRFTVPGGLLSPGLVLAGNPC